MKNETFRCLVVDDFEMIRSLVRNILVKLEIGKIEEAQNGLDAIGKIKAALTEGNPYTVVFCDWNMPEMNGLEVLKNLRAFDVEKKTQFIMVTSEGERASVLEAIKNGADDYIVKPFNLDTISKKLKKVRPDFNE